jgi:hypothetical protein
MQVKTLGDRRPLIADQGGETARFVKTVCGFGDIDPNVVIDGGSRGIILDELLRNSHLCEMGNQIKRGLTCSFTTLFETFMPLLALRDRKDIGCPILNI